jgi:hypothetical protein
MSMHPESTTVLFESRDGLLSHVQEVANRSCYVVSIKRWTADKKVVLGCVHGGKYRNRLGLVDEERKRRAGSSAFDCPFQVSGRRCSDGRWKLLVKNLEKNKLVRWPWSSNR